MTFLSYQEVAPLSLGPHSLHTRTHLSMPLLIANHFRDHNYMDMMCPDIYSIGRLWDQKKKIPLGFNPILYSVRTVDHEIY